MNAVRLRPLTLIDEEWIYRACQDADIQRWTLVPRPYEREHAHSFVVNGVGEFIRWAIVDDESGSPLGVIGIHGVDPVSGEADIGYWVAPWSRGRAAGTQALQALISWAETVPQIHHVVAKVASDNRASQLVVIRAGFEMISHQMGPAVDQMEIVPTDTYRFSLEW